MSMREQNLDRRLDTLDAFGVDEAFAGKESGRDFERPEWIRLTAVLWAGDVLVVKSVDRLGRGYGEIIGQWRAITKEVRADVVVLDMPLLDTREDRGGVTGTLISDIVLQLFSYVVQVERGSIHQRQAEGIAAARVRGVRFGRPKKRRPGLYKNTRESYLAGHITRSMKECCIKVFVFDIEKVAAWRPGRECGRTCSGRERNRR